MIGGGICLHIGTQNPMFFDNNVVCAFRKWNAHTLVKIMSSNKNVDSANGMYSYTWVKIRSFANNVTCGIVLKVGGLYNLHVF